MQNYNHRFTSREEVEKWIDDSIEEGMSSQLIYALVQKKTEELAQNKQLYLLKRREALVSGNTTVATELHCLLKECEQELRWFAEACGSFVEMPEAKERIVDAETKDELIEKLSDRLN
ncbi:MAG: hypothetical protein IAF38_20065 [Bacteroidia bacterium]|nr:hypothetical protein [Bacteroidia bacterium]